MEKFELKHCMDLDANDPLRELRSEFLLAETGSIHFDANSMGAMPKTVPEKVAWMLNEGWRNLGRQGKEKASRSSNEAEQRQALGLKASGLPKHGDKIT